MSRKRNERPLEILILELKKELEDIFEIKINERIEQLKKEELPKYVEQGICSVLDWPLDVSKAAEMLHTTNEAIYKRIERGQLPAHKHGGRVIINFKDINSELLLLHNKTDNDCN